VRDERPVADVFADSGDDIDEGDEFGVPDFLK
jgi:hypothetical protein